MNAAVAAARVAIPALVLGQLAVLAPQAHAGATPWRFATKVSATVNVGPASIGGGTVSCPESYVPVGGGMETVSTTQYERVAEYWDRGRGYHLVLHNYLAGQALTAKVTVSCALAAHVGSIEVVSIDFARNGSLAGGTVPCPSGKVAIGGGADWNFAGTNTRRIDLTSPTADGTGYYATGESPVAATLHVEAYCVPAADIGVPPKVVTQDYGATSEQFGSHQCANGTHVGAGGVLASAPGSAPDPHTYRGHTMHSYPSTPSSWSSKTSVLGGTRLTFVTWCLPASIPVVTVTQGPPVRTNGTSATFAFTATDPAGEALETTCAVDDGALFFNDCPSGSPFTLQGMPPGTHTFNAYARNVSGQLTTSVDYVWTVDTTPPDAGGPAAGPSVAGPLGVTFSEPVIGVAASSLQVRVAGTATPLAGSVTAGSTSASWTPAAPLVPGESYTVSVTSAIKDVAGNALPPESFTVRTALVVESTSLALNEYWDRDTSSAASGGGYSVSSERGASLTWRVNAASGQQASVYGLRQPGGGYGEVWVDGVKKATVSFHSASTAWRTRVYTSPPLSAGTHTIQVRALGTRPPGSSGNAVAVDWVQVSSSVYQETSARHAFQRVSHGSASGGSYDAVTHRTTGDTGSAPAYTLTFKGTGVRLYATRWTGAGPARIYVDGVLKRTINLASSTTAYKQLVWSATGLSNARHTIRVDAAGTSSGSASAVAVDYLSVT